MMTATSRRELNKLRELVHFLLRGAGASYREGTHGAHGPIVCCFCRKPLDYAEDFITHGNATGPKFTEKLSIHHLDGNHDNNIDTNKAICHTKCHKGYHRRLANEARKSKTEPHSDECDCMDCSIAGEPTH